MRGFGMLRVVSVKDPGGGGGGALAERFRVEGSAFRVVARTTWKQHGVLAEVSPVDWPLGCNFVKH